MKPYLAAMASLSAVDLVITGIFILVSGHTSVVFADLAANLLVLGLLNTAIGAVLFRPIRRHLGDRRDPQAALRRIQRLPALSAISAALATLIYCVAAFRLGVFTPDAEALAAVPAATRVLAFLWFAFAYMVFYAFFVYFLVSDVAAALRLRLDLRGPIDHAAKGRIVVKLVVVFSVVAVLPNLLIVADLTVFRELRAAQGLSVVQTVFLDLLASVFLIGVSAIFVTRSLTRPVHQLTATMTRVREGDLATRAPVVSDDELGVLAASFNAMIGAVEERAFIRDTFGRYVPDSVAAALVAKRGRLEPVLTEATILYADIADFTRIAETMAPARLVDMLNEYFSAVIRPIAAYGGVVNQFQGDAMLVTFNVPVADPDHADHALAAAAEMLAIVAGRRFAGIELRVRIGINTGDVIAGPVGSGDRVSYTVYGDAVNSAARLEQLGKEFGVPALVSGATVRRLKRPFPLESLGEVPIRGKQQTLTVFKLAAPPDSLRAGAVRGTPRLV